MIRILTWNIQYGLGTDGLIDLARTARVARAMGDPDVLCFQEVAVAFPELDKGNGADQAAYLAEMFPAHEAAFRPALDLRAKTGARRRRFGNMILSRLPLLSVASHVLPRPADSSVIHMSRQALEATVETPFGTVRIVTTHLEYHSPVQRAAQVERLRDLHAEWTAAVRSPPRPGTGTYEPEPAMAGTILCGDFNFPPEDRSYARLQAPFDHDCPSFRDAWTIAHPDKAHAPTCGIHDRAQWPEGPHARDFFFVSSEIIDRIEAVTVDTHTHASDHQPVLLTLRS